MQGAANSRGGVSPPPTLAQRSFPRRVRMLLEGVLEYASDELERGLATTLNEQEQQLFKLAEQARNNDVQARCFESLREIKRGRADVIPRFLISLEASLASLREPPRLGAAFATQRTESGLSGQLALVEDVEMDEQVVLNEIAGRAEIRNSLVLFLLGQRFGVIAGRPAFDAETLPVGPHALCRALRDAVGCLELNLENRLALYRQFDRQVMQNSSAFYEAINSYLIRQKVLPGLTFVPIRARPTAQGEPAERPAPDQERSRPRTGGRADAESLGLGAAGPSHAGDGHRRAGDSPRPSTPRSGAPVGAPAKAGAHAAAAASDTGGARKPRPFTAWPGLPSARPAEGRDAEAFEALRQLLSGRRALLGKLNGRNGSKGALAPVASPDDLQSVLGVLQGRAPAPVMVDGEPRPRSIQHVKQDLLAQLRQVSPGPTPPALGEQDADTIDLVGMLFDHIMKDVKPNSPAATLLAQLQVPLLRVALRDKGFFTRRQHPARQMLNAIAESGAYWMGDDEADRNLVHKMKMLVDRTVGEFDGDPGLFEVLLDDLSGHMQTVVRKAEVAERRHVDAARGKEKLEVSRLRAAETVEAVLANKRVPKFLHTLLCQAWADVLALTVLRHGDDSDAYRHQLRIAERLVEAATVRRSTGQTLIGPTEMQSLRGEIEEALAQVGYHQEDAQAVAARLLAASQDEEDMDAASRTELALRLKSRARLGQDVEQRAPDGEKLAPLKPEEQAVLERLRGLPFGTWFEFTVNQQGDRVRRRLSWYSTVTGHCLFVNHRGQRVGEYSLNWLARELHRGNVTVVEEGQASIIDRAWNAIVGALRSFSGGAPMAEARSGA